MTYLEMCQTLRRESGISGSGPSAVTAQTGIYEVLVEWITAADEQIQNLWHNWNFLIEEHSENVSPGTSHYVVPAIVGRWRENSFWLDKTTNSRRRLTEMRYEHWFHHHDGRGNTGTPSWIIIKPNDDLILEPTPLLTHELTAEFWRKPTRLVDASDISAIPSQYHRAVILRAKMLYAEYESANEVYQASQVEYQEVMDRLTSDQLPNNRGRLIMGGKPMIVSPVNSFSRYD